VVTPFEAPENEDSSKGSSADRRSRQTSCCSRGLVARVADLQPLPRPPRPNRPNEGDQVRLDQERMQAKHHPSGDPHRIRPPPSEKVTEHQISTKRTPLSLVPPRRDNLSSQSSEPTPDALFQAVPPKPPRRANCIRSSSTARERPNAIILVRGPPAESSPNVFGTFPGYPELRATSRKRRRRGSSRPGTHAVEAPSERRDAIDSVLLRVKESPDTRFLRCGYPRTLIPPGRDNLSSQSSEPTPDVLFRAVRPKSPGSANCIRSSSTRGRD